MSTQKRENIGSRFSLTIRRGKQTTFHEVQQYIRLPLIMFPFPFQSQHSPGRTWVDIPLSRHLDSQSFPSESTGLCNLSWPAQTHSQGSGGCRHLATVTLSEVFERDGGGTINQKGKQILFHLLRFYYILKTNISTIKGQRIC